MTKPLTWDSIDTSSDSTPQIIINYDKVAEAYRDTGRSHVNIADSMHSQSDMIKYLQSAIDCFEKAVNFALKSGSTTKGSVEQDHFSNKHRCGDQIKQSN